MNTKFPAGLEEFRIIRVLYIGTLGVIKLALHLPTTIPVILKIISKYIVVSRAKSEFVNRERTLLKQVRHPFIVTIHGTFQDTKSLYIVLEYLQGGDLYRMLKINRALSLDLVRFYSAEVVSAISHLHCRGVIYRALKPENVALDSLGHLRILDFGVAKRLNDNEKTYSLCGTPDYLAPELILSAGHNEAADWWTLGVFLFELITGRPPFTEKTLVGLYEKILNNEPHIEKISDEAAADLVRRLLQKNPEERIKMKEIHKHKFFERIDWRKLEKKLIQPLYVPVITSIMDSSNFPYVEETLDEISFIENVNLFPGF